jgi:lipoate-protein ligase A
MAIDEVLLREAQSTGATFLRLYRWAPPGCLSFGRNEPANRRFDRRAIASRGWPVVRRPTGGRAVWHEHEITYSVAAPVAQWGSLADSHRAIHQLLADAISTLGVAAQLAPAMRDPARGPCFAVALGGEIVVNGLKLVGSAQLREGPAFLQHGSILLDGSQDAVRAVSVIPGPPVPSTTLRGLLGRVVHFEEAAAAVARQASDTWGPPEASPTPVPDPSPGRYLSDDWTWRR